MSRQSVHKSFYALSIKEKRCMLTESFLFSTLTCCLFVRGCACSVYGALLFNFGSLLLFAVAKSYLPENSNLATLAGLASCYSLVKVGTSYLDHIDSNIKPQLK
jgi:hypothetical protein